MSIAAPNTMLEWAGLTSCVCSIAILDWGDARRRAGAGHGVGSAVAAPALVLFGVWPFFPLSLLSVAATIVLRGGTRAAAVRGLLARVAGAVAALGIVWALDRVGLPLGVMAGIFACWVFVCAEAVVGRILAARSAGFALTAAFAGAGEIVSSLASCASTAALLMLTYPAMHAWSLILVLALLALIQQSSALLADTQEMFRSTVEVLVQAAEGQDPLWLGHGERVSSTARAIAQRAGMIERDVERIGFAAVLHDVGAVSGRGDCDLRHQASGILGGIKFFDDILPILLLCDGETVREATESEQLGALVVALASDIDSMMLSEGLPASHRGNVVEGVAAKVSPRAKARAVAAALELGLPVPAVR